MESKTARALAENTAKFMQAREWSQRELAKEAGISQRTVGYVLNYRDVGDRHAKLDTIDGLARAFGVPPHMLLVPGYADGLRVLPSKVKLDMELLSLISAGMQMVKRGSRVDRAELAVAMYEAAESLDSDARKQVVLRLVHTANR